ncbi:hypothetical protein K491DRAFT_692730 [Lophiostoma macrostomum CBS 122681]|uniref:Uncharacterized protein n=1 Tax=Lophiostoma macrostomum CBS 122681 TaxID=1314788 RepID=A0A6A6T9V4_9PLEO|nr:hypothetical protein K491DRAFT_692730 [Lophiostoma macrostomum CBS 122681]
MPLDKEKQATRGCVARDMVLEIVARSAISILSFAMLLAGDWRPLRPLPCFDRRSI